MKVLRPILGSCVVVSAILLPGRLAGAGTITLGEAANYALLTSGGGGFSFNGPGAINGDVGIGVGGKYNFASPAVINGTMFLGTGVTGTNSGVTISGGIQTSATISANLTQAISDANTAATNAAALTATGTVPGNTIVVTNPSNSVTFNGSAGQNVLDVTDINLNNGNFTINGTSSETFIINVSGKFIDNGSASILLTGGVTAADVLFNIEGTGQDVAITGNAGTVENGTILAPSRNISIHDQTLNGAVIGAFGMSFSIQDTSGFTLNGPPTQPPFGGPTPTPLPASVWSGLALLMGFGAMRIGRRRAIL